MEVDADVMKISLCGLHNKTYRLNCMYSADFGGAPRLFVGLYDAADQVCLSLGECSVDSCMLLRASSSTVNRYNRSNRDIAELTKQSIIKHHSCSYQHRSMLNCQKVCWELAYCEVKHEGGIEYGGPVQVGRAWTPLIQFVDFECNPTPACPQFCGNWVFQPWLKHP